MAQATLEKMESAEPSRRMTWDEFICRETAGRRWEWVDGEAIKRMPVQFRHDRINGFIYVLLLHYTMKFDLGEVFGPFLMRLISRPSGREPDVSFLRKDRLDLLRKTFVDGPMDLAVEIISPESDARDREEKLSEYERGGVQEYWLLDHFKQEAFFYQLDAAGKYQRVFEDATGRYDCAVIPGFWIDVSWLWQEPKPLKEAMARLQLP